MKRFIVFLTVAVLLTAGWFLYGSVTEDSPVAEVPTPTLPAPPVTPVTPPVAPIVPPTLPAPVIPPNFIVPDEVWKSASHLLSTEGKELRGGVQFTEVPIGMKLYAPVDGWHVSIGEMLFEGASFMGVTLTPNPNPEGDRALWLIARWIEVTNFNPKKGEAFAEIREALPFPSHFDRRGVLVVSVDAIWGEQSDQTITDPRTYLWALIQAALPTK